MGDGNKGVEILGPQLSLKEGHTDAQSHAHWESRHKPTGSSTHVQALYPSTLLASLRSCLSPAHHDQSLGSPITGLKTRRSRLPWGAQGKAWVGSECCRSQGTWVSSRCPCAHSQGGCPLGSSLEQTSIIVQSFALFYFLT